MDKVEATTRTNSVIYGRVGSVKEKIQEYLLLDAILQAKERPLDLETIEIKEELINGTKKCEDNLKVTLSVHFR